MSPVPIRCVVDTNVPMTANRANASASASCVAASALALQTVMTSGHLFVDAGGLIIGEYRNNLSARGEPGPGDAFLKWVLTHEWGEVRVTRVPITARPEDTEDFEESPEPPEGIRYDRSDRKFLAVSAAHANRPAILQSFDTKWWGWRDALVEAGVSIYFLCPKEVAAKYAEKMGR